MARQINSEFDGWSALAHLGKICRYEARDVLTPAIFLHFVFSGLLRVISISHDTFLMDGARSSASAGPATTLGLKRKDLSAMVRPRLLARAGSSPWTMRLLTGPPMPMAE